MWVTFWSFKLLSGDLETEIYLGNAGNFLLTNLLLDKMKATAKATGIQGRIINISSADHAKADGSWLDLDTINDQSKYIIKHPALVFLFPSVLFISLLDVGLPGP